MAMKKFSVGKATAVVKFQVDEDEFEALPANRLPANVVVKYFEKINDSKIFEAHHEFFKTILTEDSAKIFFDRMESNENPITVSVLGDIASWLVGEVYLQGEASPEPKSS